MAARGSSSKEQITKKIMEVYPDAFIASDGKTLRVPFIEEGEPVEIKITLTAAKDCERGTSNMAEVSVNSAIAGSDNTVIAEPTQEELNKVKTLMEALNF